MKYLIDGYNLLHALGILHGRVGPTGLLKARLGLLGLLSSGYRDEASQVTVIFDASHAPPGASEAEEHHGIQVRFAVHEEQADDLIESLIEHHSAPRQLVVVSDDRRIREAAQRRRSTAWSCFEFLESLKKRRTRRSVAAASPENKRGALTQAEREFWLKEFAGLADSPELKVLSDPTEWQEIEDF
jgi:predicted RNA-binding protein with PIN domain